MSDPFWGFHMMPLYSYRPIKYRGRPAQPLTILQPRGTTHPKACTLPALTDSIPERKRGENTSGSPVVSCHDAPEGEDPSASIIRVRRESGPEQRYDLAGHDRSGRQKSRPCARSQESSINSKGPKYAARRARVAPNERREQGIGGLPTPLAVSSQSSDLPPASRWQSRGPPHPPQRHPSETPIVSSPHSPPTLSMPPAQSFIDCVRHRCLGTYVVFSMQRSASTTLCDDLRKWGANCTYERLNAGAGNAGMHFSHRLGISPNFVGSHPSEFIDRVRAALHRPPLFGFKVFPTHPFPPSYITPSTTCVVLRRQNVTAQFISTHATILGPVEA